MNRITFLLLAAFSGFGLLGCKPQRKECTFCDGSGKGKPGSASIECFKCGGRGYVVRCPACGGTAFLKDKNAACQNCAYTEPHGWVKDLEP